VPRLNLAQQTVDFGSFHRIVINGRVFDDANGDGQRQTGEAFQPGWTAFLDTNDSGGLNAGEPSTVTNSNGVFTFSGLGPGTYRVRLVPQHAWVVTTPLPTIVAQSGQNAVGLLLGVRPFRISGRVFNDLNGNSGPDSGEPGLAGRTVFLDSEGNGRLDTGARSVLTASDGSYSFTNLPDGTYTVRQVLSPQWVQTTTDPPDVSPHSADITGLNFGDFRTFGISGTVYNDLDGNANRDSGEPGLQGWTVFLDADGDGFLDNGEVSALTDSRGNYSFTNLGPGTYRVREVPQSGWTQTTLDPVDFNGISGQRTQHVNFGNQE